MNIEKELQELRDRLSKIEDAVNQTGYVECVSTARNYFTEGKIYRVFQYQGEGFLIEDDEGAKLFRTNNNVFTFRPTTRKKYQEQEFGQTGYVECVRSDCDYFTVGKIYPVEEYRNCFFQLIDDKGINNYCGKENGLVDFKSAIEDQYLNQNNLGHQSVKSQIEKIISICADIKKNNSVNDEIDESINEKFPQIGDRYYFVEKDGDVNWYMFTNDAIDQKIRSFGNFFETDEEAKEVSKKLKELWKHFGL